MAQEAFSELLRLAYGEGRGWGGCRCECHRGVAVHCFSVSRCCKPGEEDLEQFVELVRENDEARLLVRSLMADPVLMLMIGSQRRGRGSSVRLVAAGG